MRLIKWNWRELSGHIAQQYIDLLNRFLTLERSN